MTSEPNNNETDPLPLDWTRVDGNANRRYPQDVVPPNTFNKDTTFIQVVGTAGQKITHIGELFHTLVNATQTTHFILRSHLIQSMKGVRHFSNLELLELYDNQLQELEELGPEVETEAKLGNRMNITDHWPGKTIQTLDLSYNVIRSMEPVQYCIHLQILYLANNKIKEMEGLSKLTQLRILDLGANRIRVMDPLQLSGLIHLQQLWLGKNKITQIQGLDTLTQLRQLDIQCNRLTSVDNLQVPALTLEELYLADNAIDDDGLQNGFETIQFPNLSTLDISRNKLTTCKFMSHLTNLSDLWLSGNLISSFDQVAFIQELRLESLYLEYNPLYQEFDYRKKLKEMISTLEQIDAVRIDGGYGMSWTASVESNTVERESILKPTSVGRFKELQDKIVKRAEEETKTRKLNQETI